MTMSDEGGGGGGGGGRELVGGIIEMPKYLGKMAKFDSWLYLVGVIII